MKREVMLARFVETKGSVNSIEEAADAMGVTFAALDKALERARADGDRRGIYAPLHIHPLAEDRRARRHRILAGWQALESPRPSYAEAALRIGCTRQALATTLSRARREGVEVTPHLDREAILEDWEILRDGDLHWEMAAGRLGVSRSLLAQILQEARAAGDQRGWLTTIQALHQEAS